MVEWATCGLKVSPTFTWFPYLLRPSVLELKTTQLYRGPDDVRTSS